MAPDYEDEEANFFPKLMEVVFEDFPMCRQPTDLALLNRRAGSVDP
jgi:hypothetical protein